LDASFSSCGFDAANGFCQSDLPEVKTADAPEAMNGFFGKANFSTFVLPQSLPSEADLKTIFGRLFSCFFSSSESLSSLDDSISDFSAAFVPYAAAALNLELPLISKSDLTTGVSLPSSLD